MKIRLLKEATIVGQPAEAGTEMEIDAWLGNLLISRDAAEEIKPEPKAKPRETAIRPKREKAIKP